MSAVVRKVNRLKDLAERSGWTALETAAASGIIVLADGVGWQAGAKITIIATLIAVFKVIIAQRSGQSDYGAAIPGGIVAKRKTA